MVAKRAATRVLALRVFMLSGHEHLVPVPATDASAHGGYAEACTARAEEIVRVGFWVDGMLYPPHSIKSVRMFGLEPS